MRRAALEHVGDVREQRMFGGLAFLVGGHMACGVVGDELMLLLGEDGADAALDADDAVRQAAGIATRAPLEQWVGRAVVCAHSLPPKPAKR